MGDSNARNMQSSCQIEINSVNCVSSWDYMQQNMWIKLHLDLKINLLNVIVNFTKTTIRIYEPKKTC